MPLRFRILASPKGAPRATPPGPAAAAPLGAGPSEERTFELASEIDEVRIGRKPTTEIELPFPAVSLVHARLFRGESPGEWWVEDLGSTNGTWLDGARLGARRPAALRTGQRLRLATVDIVFEGWSATARGADGTATLARRLIADLFGAVGGEPPTLTVETGPARPGSVRMVDRDRRYLAGRADGCDLVLPSEHVSREHAAFVRRWDGVFVIDLGSKNGLLLNGRPLIGEVRLRDDDRVEIGPIVVHLTEPEDRYLRRLQSLGDAGEAPEDSSPRAEPSGRPGGTPGLGVAAVDIGEEVARQAAAPPARASSTPAPATEGLDAPARPRRARTTVGRGASRGIATGVVAGILILAVAGLIALLAAGK